MYEHHNNTISIFVNKLNSSIEIDDCVKRKQKVGMPKANKVRRSCITCTRLNSWLIYQLNCYFNNPRSVKFFQKALRSFLGIFMM